MTVQNEIPKEPAIRLPCRGCTRDCKNYRLCEGRLWRLDSNTRSALKAGNNADVPSQR